jgi:transcriptional regulator with GAF, ATPase, and Fis domain
MLEVFAAVRAAAESNATVLIEGESGTGKELIANAIHYNSSHADQPYVTVNCSALPENLLETELFGHVKGAFTGALRDRKGRFEEADGGTIFLDEVGELSQYMQIKLLRVLQEREIERVGENKKRKLNLRIIAATHCSLKEKLREGSFREDLYYRLKVFPISVPPLRERKEDIPLLINHFIEKQNEKTGKGIQAVGPSAMRLIMDYSWPGNVRELENAIEHAFVLCSQDTITIDDLPLEMRAALQSEQSSTANPKTAPHETSGRTTGWTRESLLQALRDCNWNKAEVARRMGVSRTAVWKYMKKWAIPLQNN